MSRKSPSLLPQVSFSVLLALSLRPRHGYEIMKQVETDSANKIKLGPGALYGAIKNLLEEKLIEAAPKDTNDRRRYYQLTKKGRSRLGADIEFYENSVRLASQRKLMQSRLWAS